MKYFHKILQLYIILQITALKQYSVITSRLVNKNNYNPYKDTAIFLIT